jgi:hypothetical protein
MFVLRVFSGDITLGSIFELGSDLVYLSPLAIRIIYPDIHHKFRLVLHC